MACAASSSRGDCRRLPTSEYRMAPPGGGGAGGHLAGPGCTDVRTDRVSHQCQARRVRRYGRQHPASHQRANADSRTSSICTGSRPVSAKAPISVRVSGQDPHLRGGWGLSDDDQRPAGTDLVGAAPGGIVGDAQMNHRAWSRLRALSGP